MDADTYISLAAIFISLCALISTIYQASLTRKHNRLSVMPHLAFEWNDITDTTVDIHVMNCGLGSALITSFEVSVAGKDLRKNDWKEAFTSFLHPDYEAEHYDLHQGDAMHSGEKIELVKVEFPDIETKKKANFLKDAFISVTYKSFYGDEGQVTFENGKMLKRQIT